MFGEQVKKSSYYSGFVASFILHVVIFFVAIGAVERAKANFNSPQQVFTVTLEGGERLGGISQVPTEDASKQKALPNAQEANQEEDSAPPPSQKESEASAVVEERKLAEEKKAAEKKEAEAKKLAEKKLLEEKKKAEEERKEAEEKKKAEEAKKKADEKKADDEKRKAKEKKERELEEKDAKLKAEHDRKMRDKALQQAIKRAASKYKGESANAGGEGFGAAALGGKGMGGGTLASMEFIAYRNQLEQHIKEGWRWLSTNAGLQARVEVSIMPDGRITNVEIINSSGNSTFDDSVVRAVWKSSPVPQAPEGLYEQFRNVRITFDSAK